VAVGDGASASLSATAPDAARAVVAAVAALRAALAATPAPDAASAADLRVLEQRLDDLEAEATDEEPRPSRLRRLLDQVTSGLQGLGSAAAAAEALRAAVTKLLG
jgi:hypothetical protein